jgi:hypothetical protein
MPEFRPSAIAASAAPQANPTAVIRKTLIRLAALLYALPASALDSYTAINGTTVQVTPYQKAINDGTAMPLDWPTIQYCYRDAIVRFQADYPTGKAPDGTPSDYIQGTAFYINSTCLLPITTVYAALPHSSSSISTAIQTVAGKR